ncbi:MAG: 50S ribosomal protein L21 [Rhodospirillales bacterium CG15_BIG_FIL_POST_REV_8_21_14_020_66_15]|nr:MAG: 50S ribosomal protein L21 [Rhodospirillales bacterium CG15_BIG_FIL_POST_REV_8_21_14_020_66_15]
MYAVIKTGGKQYRVTAGDVITVEKLLGEPGETIEVGQVMMLGEEGKAPTLGAPVVEKAAVFAEVLEQQKGDKVLVFKKKRRQNYRRLKGHRQFETVLRIVDVSATGAKPAAAKKAEKKAEAEPKADAKAEAKPAKKPAAKKESKAEAKPAAKKPAAKKAPAKKAAPKKGEE